MLSNLETSTQKLLQIIFFGQPEMKDVLNRRDLLQLRQRINVRYHLRELTENEVLDYLAHRLNVAGADTNCFTQEASRAIWQLSGGIPRVINMLADRAMLAAYAQNSGIVDTTMVENAQADLEGVHS